MPTAELEKVLRHLDAHRPKERTLQGIRAYVDAMVGMEPVASDVAISEVVVGGIPAERLVTPGADPTSTLLYLHGGGYSLGSARGYRPLAGRLARAFGGAVVVLDYRLAPEHPFPAGLTDALSAARELLTTPSAGRRLMIGGDSAGGGLAVATLLSLRAAGEPMPAAAALLSPWVDLSPPAPGETRAADDPIVTREGMENLAQMYLGDRSRQDPLASPTHARLEGLPPMLLQLGTRELQYGAVTRFGDKLRAAGVPVEVEIWEGMLHVFQMFPVLPDASRAIARIGAYLRSRLS